jgi:hypothetical protein
VHIGWNSTTRPTTRLAQSRSDPDPDHAGLRKPFHPQWVHELNLKSFQKTDRRGPDTCDRKCVFLSRERLCLQRLKKYTPGQCALLYGTARN